MAEKGESDRETESRRILDRVSREAESGGASMAARLGKRARNHVAARDVDRADWAEYWGTRIGRVLGLVLIAGLIVWLVLFVIRGG
jgi:hypothetical protein